MPVQYFYTGNAPTTTATAGQFQPLTDTANPIFNFNQQFITDFQDLSSMALGQSVPYISLSAVDLQGTILKNFNVQFFHKQFDFSTIGQSRFSDRPLMSIKSLEVSSNAANGYLYVLDVRITLKLHSPDALTRSELLFLLFPGLPLLLEYGRNGSPGVADFLNQREILFVSVKDYTITMDQSGQSELVINATAFNDRFNNTLIGDGSAPGATARVSAEEQDGIEHTKTTTDAVLAHVVSNSQSNNYALKRLLAESYRETEDKVRGSIKAQFQARLSQLSALATTQRFGLKSVKVIPFHDIVHTLIVPTLNAMEGAIFPSMTNFRIIYGTFNNKFSSFADKSIADFPIDWNMLDKIIGDDVESGITVQSIQSLLNHLIRDFIEKDSYWRTVDHSQEDGNYPPDVVVNFTNRVVGQDRFAEIVIFDVSHNLPVTTLTLPQGTDSVQNAEAGFVQAGVPIIRMAHANSFISDISLSHISDPNMKAVLIKRMQDNRLASPRDPIPQGKARDTTPDTPLVLPLRATMNVLGHIEWKPFRFFYLSTGNFLIDGVYKILSVKHMLSADGFKTSLDIMHH